MTDHTHEPAMLNDPLSARHSGDAEPLCDIEWMRKRLGYRSVRSVHRRIREDGLPCVRIGRDLKFRPSQVNSWIEEQQRRQHCGRPFTPDDYIGLQELPGESAIHLYNCPRCRSSVSGPAPEALAGGGRGVVMGANATDGAA